MSRRLFLLLVVTAAAALFAACASKSSSGSPPTVKDLVLTPTTLNVNTATKLNGSCTIEDPDGDIVGLSHTLTFPDGHTVPLADTDFAAGGATSAAVVLEVQALTLPAAGLYTVSVYARDAAGNRSPALTVALTAR